jgi:hypothetical protein
MGRPPGHPIGRDESSCFSPSVRNERKVADRSFCDANQVTILGPRIKLA